MRRRQRRAGTAAVAAALLLRLGLAAAGWVDVAFTLPPDLLGPSTYRPISWTAEQVDGMRRRALLQQAAGGGPSLGGSGGKLALPVCELGLSYRIVELEGGNFTSVVTLQNNRELDLAHWQIVWRYSDYRSVGLLRTQGAIALSLGSSSGAPVRLVDTFTSDGVPGGGGAFSFLAEAAVGGPQPPDADQTLAIEAAAVNINGMTCSLAGSGGMAYGQCLDKEQQQLSGSKVAALEGSDEAAVAALLAGGSWGSSSGACWSHFCCGVVLIDPTPPPPPPQPSPPPPAAPSPTPPAPESPAQPSPPSPEQPDQPVLRKSNSSLVAAAAGGGGGAAGALLLSAAFLMVRRHRRQQRKLAHAAFISKTEQQAAGDPDGSGSGRASGDGRGSSSAATPREAGATLTLHGSPTLSSLLSPKGGLLRPQGSTAVPAPGTPGGGTAGECILPGSMAAGCEERIMPTLSGSGAITAKVAGDGSGSGSGCLETASSSKSSLADEIQLHEQLGSGAFGVVYRGQWRGLPVAVKVLQTACGAASRELESFRQEARVLAQLQHPNIVCFLAACTVPPNICIVEELAEGGSLHTLLHGRPGARRRRPLPYPKLLQVATDVAEAMVYLHPRIVHRDLKSQNVLLDAAGRAKVCDFGIAKFKNNTLVSSAGGQAGTPAYMAPETFDGKRVNEKVDVYSFAILCWEMLTGRVPWRELAGHMQIIFQVGVMRQRLPLPDTCPPFLRALIEECWEEDPAARPAFPAIRQRLREEIARVAAEEPHHSPSRCVSTTDTDVSSALDAGSAGPSSRAASWQEGGSGALPLDAAAAAVVAGELEVSPFAGYGGSFGGSSGSGRSSSGSDGSGSSGSRRSSRERADAASSTARAAAQAAVGGEPPVSPFAACMAPFDSDGS